MPVLHWFTRTPRNARRFPPCSRGPLPIIFRNCPSKIAARFSSFRLLRYRRLSTYLCAIRLLLGMRPLHIINEIYAHILPFAHHASCMRCPCLHHANVHVFLNMTVCLYVIHAVRPSHTEVGLGHQGSVATGPERHNDGGSPINWERPAANFWVEP